MSGFASALDPTFNSGGGGGGYAYGGGGGFGNAAEPLVVQAVPVASGYGTAGQSLQQQQQQQQQQQLAVDEMHRHGYPVMAGFELWIPPKATTYADGLPIYEILGTEAQIVQFPVRPGRQIMCFSGAMCYMSDGLKMSVALAGLGKTFGRLAGGGSLFQITYTNESDQLGYVAMTPDYPGVIIPINMQACPSGKVIALRDSFLCATVSLGQQTTDVSAGFNPANSIAGICCGGVDLIVQTLSNGEWAFVMSMGTVVTKILNAGEKILVDTDAILCFEESVQIDVTMIGTGLACCCAGEGLFNTTMTGPGKIWIQSMGIDKMRKLFPPKVVQQGGDSGGNSDGDS